MKLLFWMNVFMLHFGIAYYLKEKVNAEFTAIIDTPNKPKQMFLNQKIVNFKKTWYFHDHIKKIDTTPDLEYLSNFEKKYNIVRNDFEIPTSPCLNMFLRESYKSLITRTTRLRTRGCPSLFSSLKALPKEDFSA